MDASKYALMSQMTDLNNVHADLKNKYRQDRILLKTYEEDLKTSKQTIAHLQ